MTALALLLSLFVQDKTFSGPQKGEKTPGFKVLDMTGESKGKEIDFIETAKGAPSLIVFMHEITRPAAAVMRKLDEAAAIRPTLKSIFVLLTDDMNSTEQRTPMMQGALKFKTPWAISVDGKEGPGSYGLNKTVTLTVLLAKDNLVVANWAITAPADTDAPAIIKEIQALVPVDRIAELEARVAALEKENADLKAQIAKLKEGQPPKRQPVGKAPTDPTLNGAMRKIIRQDSSEADVDAAFKEINDKLAETPDLKQQAIDGYMLLIDLKYGGEYAQKKLKEALDALRK